MKRVDLERHLGAHGRVLHHHSKSHDVWINPDNLKKSPVPRHREIKKGTALGICRILEIPKPPNL